MSGTPVFKTLEELVDLLWKVPEREFHYAAMDFMNLHSKELPNSLIPAIEHYIVTKSWWDSVDFLCSKQAGEPFQLFPEKVILFIRNTNLSKLSSCEGLKHTYKN